MNHTLNEAIAGSRERELRTVVRRPDRLMAHALDLEIAATQSSRSRHPFLSRRRSS